MARDVRLRRLRRRRPKPTMPTEPNASARLTRGDLCCDALRCGRFKSRPSRGRVFARLRALCARFCVQPRALDSIFAPHAHACGSEKPTSTFRKHFLVVRRRRRRPGADDVVVVSEKTCNCWSTCFVVVVVVGVKHFGQLLRLRRADIVYAGVSHSLTRSDKLCGDFLLPAAAAAP